MIPALDAELARLSALAYKPWKEVAEQLSDTSWRIAQTPIARGGAEAMLASRGDAAALVFRGTEFTELAWSDLFANWPLPLVAESGGTIHGGYYQYFVNIDCLADALAKHVPPGVPLYVTGHSLGGALAHLYAAHARVLIHRVVTFGAPKAADAAMWSRIPRRVGIRRYVVKLDPFPHWPWIDELCHPARPIYVPATSWWPGPFARHSVTEYVLALHATCDQRRYGVETPV